MSGINKIRDTIETAIEISKDSNVPVLLLSNPGLAKSTIVANWASRRAYHLETLIGSRFTQEEILGFQVRVEDADSQHLELLEPYWYRNILEHEKNNIPSVLFLDELSTVQENVQGAMLQLIFDRTIGHNKNLPASTLIIAAANYKQNIPFLFNIMAPVLNRFCIVNLQYENTGAFLEEFLQDENTRTSDIINFKSITIDSETKKMLREGLKTIFKTIATYFEENNSKSALDINNQLYNNIYESDSAFVYNFITGRSVYYLYRITLSFLSKGLSLEDHSRIMITMVFGLVGLGTNSFSEFQQRSYLTNLEKLYLELYSTLQNMISDIKKNNVETEIDFSGLNICDAVNRWVLYADAANSGKENSLNKLLKHIESVYPACNGAAETIKAKVQNTDAVYSFVSDMQKIDYLTGLLEKKDANSSVLSCLTTIQAVYADLKKELLE
ncbi:MAG: ATP-binding protein, partial [Spirochaetaceae bacterium]|nr:ATP-binding protein [Spirochaetaceae bacterium]